LKRGSSLGSDPNNTGTSVVLQRNNIEIIEIKVPGNKCGLVIGKGGETIKRLSEQYGVKLVVVQESSAASSGDKPLRITGEPEKVAAAKEAVLQMLDPKDGPYQQQQQQHRSDYGSRHHGGAQGVTEAFIKVPGDKAGIVIGKGGESIKDINRRSGAHVEIDKSQRGPNATDGVDKMFIIKGTNEQIQYAQQLIYEKITGVIIIY
jgi:far upstream element-binding protein